MISIVAVCMRREGVVLFDEIHWFSKDEEWVSGPHSQVASEIDSRTTKCCELSKAFEARSRAGISS
jgi:hypothetical protein